MRTMQDVLHGLRAEFVQMPGLRLSAEQVQRVCKLERTVCNVMLQSLVDEKFLYMRSDGAYAQAADRMRNLRCDTQPTKRRRRKRHQR